MNTKYRNVALDQLFQGMLELENIDQCYAFFDDICTIHELQAMSQRLQVAIMLNQSKTYVEIGELTGASTATISRVNRALHYGSDGYKLVLEKLGYVVHNQENKA